jgi:DNA-directed RNA polymerase subunit M/transcription elongation factor TFIIS
MNNHSEYLNPAISKPPCPRCHLNSNVVLHVKQIRAGDEAIMIMYACNTCGGAWMR